MLVTKSSQQLAIIAFHLVIALAVLTSVTVLTALHDQISTFVAGIFGALVGLAGASGASVATLGTALNGKSAVDPQLIANQQTIMREQGRMLAGNQPIEAAAIERAARVSDLPSTAPPNG